MINFESLPTQSSTQTKLEYFTELSQYTYDHYGEHLGPINQVFTSSVYTIYNWKQYSTGEHSNIGKKIEQVIVNYCLSHSIFSERGHDDILIDTKQVEVKSSQNNTINLHLQTSFCPNIPDKFYCFVTNTSLPDIELRIVSSEILYYLSLGHTITQELLEGGDSLTLNTQLKEGLGLIDFYPLLVNLIKTGNNLDVTKSFKIGDKVRIRFITQIEIT
jgi:hypothetical protein